MTVSSVAGKTVETTQSTITVQKPTGTQAGDILIAVSSETDNTSYEITGAPTDWTQVQVAGTGIYAYAGVRSQVWWKRAGASEPASYSWPAAGAFSYQAVSIVALRGCLPSGNPIEVAGVNSGSIAATTGAPSVAVTSDHGMRLCLFAADSTSANDLQPVSPLVEFTGTPAAHARATSVAGATYAAAGNLPAGMATPTESARGPKVAWTLALPAGNTTPNAPVPVSPVGGVAVSRANPIVLSAEFSDPDPGDSPSASQWRYRVTGTATWTTVEQDNPLQSYSIPAGVAAGEYEWQTAYADQAGTWGPFCGSEFFTAADPPPGPTVLDPAAGATIGTSSYTFVISTPSLDESEWTLYADDGAGSIDTGTILQGPVTVTPADGDVRRHTFTGLANNVPVWLSVRDKFNGLWSQPVRQRNPVSYTPPAVPSTAPVAATDAAGAPVLSIPITNPAPAAGEPAVVSNDVWLREAGNQATRRRVAKDVAPNGTATYRFPLAGVEYEVQIETKGDNNTTSLSAWTG